MLGADLLGMNNASFTQNLKMVGQRRLSDVITTAATTSLLAFLGDGFHNFEPDWIAQGVQYVCQGYLSCIWMENWTHTCIMTWVYAWQTGLKGR